ncbi:MAG TPA: LLM class flavin-dependent oxidoreductase [Pseudonocardiaceae bacterium]|nr:LLM class flavin-dependent oxidoreductase [Pseudonocardiaceae bacterium]
MIDLDVGVLLPTMSANGSPGDVVAAARQAEDAGLDSVWVVDQLVAGTGVPVLDSLTALAAAAAVTDRVKLGVGVLILPLRPIAWVAKQVASLQHISGDRLLLGVGVGGDRHDRSWAAAGVSARERGRLTDAALDVLPALIAGQPTRIGDAEIQLSPAATVPPIIVGGMSDAAVRRAALHGDGWFPLGGPDNIDEQRARLAAEVAKTGRPMPELTANAVVALPDDPELPDRAGILQVLTDPDGMFGFPPDAAEDTLVHGDPSVVAEHLAAFAAQGVRRVVVTLPAGDWLRQAELLGKAARYLG